MTDVSPAPLYHPLIEDVKNPVASNPWILFFNSLQTGSTGSPWGAGSGIPVFTNLTSAGGAPTITGRYYKLSQAITVFFIDIVPAPTGSTSSVAGTTYCNFPLKMNGNGVNFAVSGLLGAQPGMCDKASNRIYVPGWTTVTVPLTIIGIVEAS